MALAHGKINPLNLLGMRRLTYIPPHFVTLTVENKEINIIDQWIYFNLNSRYCIKTTQVLDAQRKLVSAIVIGMEDAKELTMFSLAYTFLHKTN
jgi:hypothetical protein